MVVLVIIKLFNYVEGITILACKQISFNSFKNEITYKLFTYKQMTNVKVLLLHNNTWNHLTVCKQMIDNSK